jgi:hypothetical protein
VSQSQSQYVGIDLNIPSFPSLDGTPLAASDKKVQIELLEKKKRKLEEEIAKEENRNIKA